MHYGVIMAGGAGTRLWPLSRGAKPKQLLKVIRGKSLLQLSYERLRGLLPRERIFVCTGEAHRQAVEENLPELPRDNILGEPTGRDTANAVGFPAAVRLQTLTAATRSSRLAASGSASSLKWTCACGWPALSLATV